MKIVKLLDEKDMLIERLKQENERLKRQLEEQRNIQGKQHNGDDQHVELNEFQYMHTVQPEKHHRRNQNRYRFRKYPAPVLESSKYKSRERHKAQTESCCK